MPTDSETLDKSLGLLDVYALATGATLSAGFFILPGLAAQQAGPALVLAYILAAVPLVPAILSKVELMTAMPRSGGIYFFLDRSLGPAAGTIGGIGTWLTLLLKVSFALVGMGAYLDLFLPQVNIVPVAVGLAVAIGAVNLVGAKITGKMQIALLAVVLTVLIGFMGMGVPRIEAANFHDFFGEGAESLVATTGLVYVSYAGLTKIAGVAEEVREPEKNLPLGVFLSLITALAVYGVGTAVIVGVVPMGELQGSLTSAAEAAQAIGGRWAMVVVSVAALLAFTAVTNAGTMSASRYPLAMSRDSVLPRGLKKLNGRGIPARSVVLTVATMILVIVLFDPMKIAKLASAFKLFVFALVCLSVVVMRESRIEEYDPGYRTPFYPWLQIVGILSALVLISTMGWLAIGFSTGLVIVGVVWYRTYVKENASREGAIYHLFDRLGEQRYEGLEDELREILQEKGLREADPYGEMLGRAQVAEIEGEASFEEVVRDASERLSRALPADADRLTDTFLEETQLGVTPVSHGAALPHVRLDGVDIPHLLLVRSRSGLEIEDVEESESTAYGQEDEDTGEEQRDGSRVHAIFFLVSPEADPRQHLRMLAKLADHVQDDAFLEDWLAAEGEHELKEVMLKEERIVALHVERGRDTARLVDRPIGELDLPPEVIPTLIRRGEDVEVPTADTVLREGDCVTLLGTPAGIRTVRKRYRA